MFIVSGKVYSLPEKLEEGSQTLVIGNGGFILCAFGGDNLVME